MNYKNIVFIFFFFFIYGCELPTNTKKEKLNFEIENKYKNSGFALIYNDELDGIKKIEPRSLNIYHKTFEKKIYGKNNKSN